MTHIITRIKLLLCKQCASDILFKREKTLQKKKQSFIQRTTFPNLCSYNLKVF